MKTSYILLVPERVLQIFSNNSPATWILAGVGTAITFLFGSLNIGAIFGSLMLLDCVLGWTRARNTGEMPDSQKMWKMTYIKVMGYFVPLLVISLLAVLTLECLPAFFATMKTLQLLVIWLFCVREAISVLENAAIIFGNKPELILQILKVLKGTEKKIGKKLDELADD